MTIKGLTFLTDASGFTLNCALARNGEFLGEVSLEGSATEKFPAALSALLDLAHAKISDVNTFILCEGPGSTFGTRSASVSIYSMKNFLAGKVCVRIYDALVAAAAVLIARGEKNFSVVVPSRKGFANLVEVQDGAILNEREVEENSAFRRPTYLLKQRATSPKTFEGLSNPDIKMSEIMRVVNDDESAISRPAPAIAIDAKSLSEREYVKWKAQAHI